ncbi:MAG TPA: 2'-5' RNA ligase family protein [Alphaproteobacteria bacterium]|nr:2'-5' RNA ligase family protein [Alphaproteobacteria bacterium]
MFEQPPLPGFEPQKPKAPTDGRQPDVKHAIFFAVFLENDAAARAHALAQALCREHRLMGRPIAAKRLHVSLVGFGEFPRVPHRLVRLVSDVASTVAIPAFDVSLDRVVTFGKAGSNVTAKRPTVLTCGEGKAELTNLRKSLSTVLADIGLFRSRTSAFVPHVTLLYDQSIVAERPVDPIRWTVREFRLVDSLRGRTLHVPLGRWRLGHGSFDHPG